jgi:hypothetical protein
MSARFNQELPFGSGNGFRILPKRFEIHARNEILDDADVAKRRPGSLKGKDRFLFRAKPRRRKNLQKC